MTRGGRKKERMEPERRCIATGARAPASGLIRFVVAPDGRIAPDIAGKLPGRGIWVSADPAALATAVRKGLFARAARQPVGVPDDLAAGVEEALARRVVELVSLSRKAGTAVAGFEKVRDCLVKGQAAVLLQASDGSGRGKSKLHAPPSGGDLKSTFIGCLTASELGLAFGREHVIHAALAAGGLTARVVEDAARLSAMRGRDGDDDAGKDTKDA